MATKAKLLIILKADDTVVAELDNPKLWQQVLAAANSGAMTPSPEIASSSSTLDIAQDNADPLQDVGGNKPIERMAKAVGVDLLTLTGAIDPKIDSPFLTIDVHSWEQMKKKNPARGIGAISPIALASTLLAVWFKEAGLGNPTQAQALEILKGIGVEDKNPSRGIKSTKWLQSRGSNGLQINPAEFSKAVAVVKAFCTKSWPITE